jgi:hypothetical protein
MSKVNTVEGLMTGAARALQERNTDELFELIKVVQDWLQTEEERNAQLELLETMVAACEELAELEEDLAVEEFNPPLQDDDE